MPWENTEQYIRSGHRDPEEFQKDTLKTITLNEKAGIKAVVGKPKGDPVYLSAGNKVSPATAAQDCIGVAVKSAASGEQCPVLVRGRVKVKAGDAITRGKAVYGADASKRVLELTDQAVNEGGSASYTIYYNRNLGTALQTATAADDLLFIQV